MNNPSCAEQRYREALAALPRPGDGFHTGLMRPANLGRLAGRTAKDVEADIERAVRPGTRPVRSGEINEAVAKAFDSASRPQHGSPPRDASRGWQSPRDAKRLNATFVRLREKIIANGGRGVTPDEVMRKSPLPVSTWPIHEHSWRLIEALYGLDERIYIGGLGESTARQEDHVLPAASWAEKFRMLDEVTASRPYSGDPVPLDSGEVLRRLAALRGKEGTATEEQRPPEDALRWWKSAFHSFIIANPLSGKPGQTKQGTQTLRGDSCVSRFMVCIGEFDCVAEADGSRRVMPVVEQLAFWRGLRGPVVALVDTGGKSIHAWLKVRVDSAEEWTERVENRLFGEYLQPLGVDPACSNESRFSRLPGVLRLETERWQRLLWLAPDGEVIP